MYHLNLNKQLYVLVAISILLSSGCSTLPSGRGWGQDASLNNWARIKQAAADAISDPETWVPLTGAAVFTVDDFDQQTSNWLSRETPVFGSNKAAGKASNDLKEALAVIKVATALVTPSGDTVGQWLPAKLKGLAVVIVAGAVPSALADNMKQEIGRTRPDGSDDLSFPSGRTTQAYASSTLASRNVNSLAISGRSKTFMRYTFKGMAAGTAWARVEAKSHYPSDVLFAAAMSHFLSAFIHDAFMGLDEGTRVMLEKQPGGLSLQLGWRF